MLALLVALDGFGVGVEALEQDVARRRTLCLLVTRRCASGCAQPSGAGANDCNLVHAENK
jgi:hypothetical protein